MAFSPLSLVTEKQDTSTECLTEDKVPRRLPRALEGKISSSIRNLFVPEPGCQGGCCQRLHPPHPPVAAHRTRPLATALWTIDHHLPPLPASVGMESSTYRAENEERSGVSLGRSPEGAEFG